MKQNHFSFLHFSGLKREEPQRRLEKKHKYLSNFLQKAGKKIPLHQEESSPYIDPPMFSNLPPLSPRNLSPKTKILSPKQIFTLFLMKEGQMEGLD